MMADTDIWVKDQLVSQAKTQTKIMGKLDAGNERMERIEESLTTVVEATCEFQPMKIDVEQLKKAEELRVKEERLKLEEELKSLKKNKAMWGERAWGLFVSALPYIIIASAFIYTQIKDQL